MENSIRVIREEFGDGQLKSFEVLKTRLALFAYFHSSIIVDLVLYTMHFKEIYSVPSLP